MHAGKPKAVSFAIANCQRLSDYRLLSIDRSIDCHHSFNQSPSLPATSPSPSTSSTIRGRVNHRSLMADSRDNTTTDDLKSPLLLNQHNNQQLIINITTDGQGGGGVDGGPRLHQATNGERERERERDDRRRQDLNPFESLGPSAADFSLPRLSPIDPFRNHTPTIAGVYGLVKLVVTVPLALARLVLFGLSLVVGYLATMLASQGWKDRQSPMPRWRSRAMWITRICARCILFSFGYQWIKRIGRPVSREIAPIVVSNHISYVEPIFFFYELFPTIVAAESHDSIPFVGTIIRAMQVIYVDRFSAASRKNAVNEIKRKASCNDFPRVLLFPEGTTTNGRSLISFQLGAFIPGLPVQPVIVRYPHVHFDQSWGNVSLAKLMFRMFTQFHNFMEVEYLPIILPPESKQENAVRLAERTSYAMASALNVVQTSHSYGDSMLVTRASELTRGECSSYLVEMASVESSFSINTSEAMDLLDQFCAMNPDSNGRVKIHDFLSVYGLGYCRLSEKIFHYLDLEQKGSITFRQFLLGSAHVRKQPLFWNACEIAFSKCSDDPGAADHISLNHLGNIIRSSMPHTTDESVQQLFYLFDVDSDGIISRDDFMMCLRRNPLLIAIFAAYTG